MLAHTEGGGHMIELGCQCKDQISEVETRRYAAADLAPLMKISGAHLAEIETRRFEASEVPDVWTMQALSPELR